MYLLLSLCTALRHVVIVITTSICHEVILITCFDHEVDDILGFEV